MKRALISGIYEQNKELDVMLSQRREQMAAAKKMVRELKGKEQAIKWGIIRNDKKDTKRLQTQIDKEQREYYDIVRR